jgi:hypothetical protein
LPSPFPLPQERVSVRAAQDGMAGVAETLVEIEEKGK